MTTEAFWTLLRVYAQTLALSLLFAASGQFLYRKVFTRRGAPGPASLRWSFSYFLGITAFYPGYLLFSRAAGAKIALVVTLAVMVAVAARETVAVIRRPRALVTGLMVVGTIVILVGVFSSSTCALWLGDLYPRPDIALLDHFGSVHAGRYANYAVYIAEHDRIPFLGQNGGQSLLASVHLILGPDSPLAALMVWVPFSLAYLALLFFGLLRAEGFPAIACAAAAAAIMLCNVALSLVQVGVFDNGSPFAFIGYTDMVVAIGTFLAFGAWVADRLDGDTSPRGAPIALAILFGLSWPWYAPQNLVVAPIAALATAFFLKRGREALSLSRLGGGLAALFIAAIVGALQFGSLLPNTMREDTGLWEQEVRPELKLRPYVQFVRGEWTTPTWNEPEPDVYQKLYAAASPVGADEVYRVRAWTAETSLWASVRIYGFVLLGLAGLGWMLGHGATGDAQTTLRWRSRWWFSVSAFVIGFAIVYLFELGGKKWWLTRFLVPGTATSLVCLAYCALRGGELTTPLRRWAAWIALLVVATSGPLLEVAMASYRNLVEADHADPVAERLQLLATRRGPFVFEMLLHDDTVATRVDRGVFKASGGWFELGGSTHRQGLALHSPPMPVTSGKRHVDFCLQLDATVSPGTALIALDAVDGAGEVLARHEFRRQDLQAALRCEWASLHMDLPRPMQDATFRVWSRSDAPLKILAMRIVRE